MSKQEIVFIINPIAGKGKNNIEKDIIDTFALTDFIPIIEKHFKQPKEGLGNDDSPSAHMWRTLIKPDRVL